MPENKHSNPFVSIAFSIGAMTIPIVGIIAIFAQEHLMVAVWIVGFLTIMGAFLGAMALKKENQK